MHLPMPILRGMSSGFQTSPLTLASRLNGPNLFNREATVSGEVWNPDDIPLRIGMGRCITIEDCDEWEDRDALLVGAQVFAVDRRIIEIHRLPPIGSLAKPDGMLLPPVGRTFERAEMLIVGIGCHVWTRQPATRIPEKASNRLWVSRTANPLLNPKVVSPSIGRMPTAGGGLAGPRTVWGRRGGASAKGSSQDDEWLRPVGLPE